MGTLHTNFVSGTLSAGIGNSDSTMASAAFADLPVVSGSDILKLILDPFGEAGAPEVVYVTTHAASSTTVGGLLRGQDQSENAGAARSHDPGTLVIHAPVASDYLGLIGSNSDILNNPGNVLATAAPVPVAAGGATIDGTAPSVSRSDHRHALAAAAAGGAVPGDVAAEGGSAAVARADHKHGMLPWATVLSPIGTALAPGDDDTYARGDHVHTLGPGALNDAAMFGGSLRARRVATSTTLPTGQVVGTEVFLTDTQRVATLVATGPDVWTYDVARHPFGMVLRSGNINPVVSPNETKLTGFVSAETPFRMTYTSSGLTIVESGLYWVGANVGFASVSGSTNMFRLASVWVNDAPAANSQMTAAGDAQGSGTAGHGYCTGAIGRPLRLSAGNTLSVWVRQNYTSAIGVTAMLWAEKIRD